MSQRHRYDLDKLVSEITLENRHSEVEVGPPAGEEFSWGRAELRDQAVGLKRTSKRKSPKKHLRNRR
jgi:hypothetical protein